ncbi:hypothetical protein FRB91_007585 [Serendipita sp. 411]|nr:hypothetical protein FRB91_007585 [Serendipita sp. 411]
MSTNDKNNTIDLLNSQNEPPPSYRLLGPTKVATRTFSPTHKSCIRLLILAYPRRYSDGAARTFTAGGFTSATMTIDKCVAYCNTNNYIYAGLEYSQVRLPPILSPPNHLLVVLVVGMLLTRLPLGML